MVTTLADVLPAVAGSVGVPVRATPWTCRRPGAGRRPRRRTGHTFPSVAAVSSIPARAGPADTIAVPCGLPTTTAVDGDLSHRSASRHPRARHDVSDPGGTWSQRPTWGGRADAGAVATTSHDLRATGCRWGRGHAHRPGLLRRLRDSRAGSLAGWVPPRRSPWATGRGDRCCHLGLHARPHISTGVRSKHGHVHGCNSWQGRRTGDHRDRALGELRERLPRDCSHHGDGDGMGTSRPPAGVGRGDDPRPPCGTAYVTSRGGARALRLHCLPGATTGCRGHLAQCPGSGADLLTREEAAPAARAPVAPGPNAASADLPRPQRAPGRCVGTPRRQTARTSPPWDRSPRVPLGTTTRRSSPSCTCRHLLSPRLRCRQNWSPGRWTAAVHLAPPDGPHTTTAPEGGSTDLHRSTGMGNRSSPADSGCR